MANILVVEDDIHIQDMMVEYLSKQHETCIRAYSGTEALLQLQLQDVHLIIMDLMLPGMNGEELILKIRALNERVPVIVVSAKSELANKIELLQNGADDYICKPFALEELYVRIQVQLRKHKPDLQKSELHHGILTLKYDQRTLVVQDVEVLLTRHEYKIMELLLTHPKQAFTKKEIYEYAWEDIYAADDKTINVHISNIRTKCQNADIIETIWGIGFKLKA